MRILFYNWVDYLDDEKRGGGVSVYQKNVIHALEHIPATTCLFLSSGISYDLRPGKPRWERVRHGPAEDRDIRYEIVNSGVLSPAHHDFGVPAQVSEPATEAAFFDFLEKKGPFDVVHFNNLEGIPARVLALKERYPETRVVFSMHNYYPLCPQVNLWREERENCTDFKDGHKCLTCLPHRHDRRAVRLADAVAFNLKKRGIRPGSRLFDRAFGPSIRLAGRALRFYQRRFGRRPELPPQDDAPQARGPLHRVETPNKPFQRRRAAMSELINTHCDAVLCVSDRVGEVARHFGIAPGLIHTSYIGSPHAAKFDETHPRETLARPDGTLTLGYLGYMRRDKGFFFLLDALEKLPLKLSRRIELVIAARLSDQPTMERITALSERFRAVWYTNGYKPDELDRILADVDVGVVPVLWEDNLPQVAIEMHARHIPLLTSDLGGAQELGRCKDMVFKAGDAKAFRARLEAILEGRIDARAYWEGAMHPHSMQTHLAELAAVYAHPARPPELLASAPKPARKPAPGKTRTADSGTAGSGAADIVRI